MHKKALKIAVNTRLLLHDRLDGIGRFATETLRHITTEHPEHEFLFIFDRQYHPDFIFSGNIKPVVVPPQARHPLLFFTWFELSIPIIIRQHKPDLFFSPDGFLSQRLKVPTVGVIHDLNFEHFPADVPWSVRMYYQNMFPRFARKADRLATVSHYSKQDIVKLYHIPETKIDVVYNGSSLHFKPLSEEDKQLVRKQYAGGNPYFFFVGTLHPRKNLSNLFLSFDKFKTADQKGTKLVIAGAKMWWTNEIRASYDQMKHKEDVIFTGRVSDEDLSKLMASALALTYVSYFEGFGIPILEAFNSGTPVITSNITSMPEVAGDAALYVDPFSVESISGAMHMMSDDASLRNKLIASGNVQKEKFSWKLTADKLWNTIERTLSTS